MKQFSIALLILLPFSIASGQKISRQSDRPEQQVQEIDSRIREGVRMKNEAILRYSIADNFLLTDDRGRTVTKSEFISQIIKSSGEEIPTAVDEMRVRVYANVSVLTYRRRVTRSVIIGDFSGQWRETHVFVKRQGRWRLVSSQQTLIARRQSSETSL